MAHKNQALRPSDINWFGAFFRSLFSLIFVICVANYLTQNWTLAVCVSVFLTQTCDLDFCVSVFLTRSTGLMFVLRFFQHRFEVSRLRLVFPNTELRARVCVRFFATRT